MKEALEKGLNKEKALVESKQKAEAALLRYQGEMLQKAGVLKSNHDKVNDYHNELETSIPITKHRTGRTHYSSNIIVLYATIVTLQW